MTGDIVVDDDENVVSVRLAEVPQDGELALRLQQLRLLTRLVPTDIVALQRFSGVKFPN